MKLPSESLAQYEALTSGVGVSQLSARTIIDVTGSDRTQFLQSFTTNDVNKLLPGRGCETFVTNSQGKTLGHVLIFCQADKYVLDTTPGQAAALISHFERYVITEDVQFADRTADLCDLLIAGPRSSVVLSGVTGVDTPTDLLSHAPATIAGSAVTVRRVEYAGPMALFVQTFTRDGSAVAAALSGAGAVICDAAAVDAARLEAGVPLFGIDITPENLPQEVARDDRAISFTKGCYLGQETVARIDAVGHVNRLLVGLKLSSEELPNSGLALLANDQQIGHVTSSAWSPRLARPLALGYVRRSNAKPSSQLSSAAGLAEVVKLPLS